MEQRYTDEFMAQTEMEDAIRYLKGNNPEFAAQSFAYAESFGGTVPDDYKKQVAEQALQKLATEPGLACQAEINDLVKAASYDIATSYLSEEQHEREIQILEHLTIGVNRMLPDVIEYASVGAASMFPDLQDIVEQYEITPDKELYAAAEQAYQTTQ